MARPVFSMKQGQTFKMSCQVGSVGANTAFTGQSIAGLSFFSQIRTQGNRLVEQLVATITNSANGSFSLESAGTHNWPIGVLNWDICVTGPATNYTETVTIEVLPSVTVLGVV